MSLVDIIIPAYNPGRYILDALYSCVNQTYKYINITVVDDASTEDVAGLISEFEKVSYLRLGVNAGPSASRNYGILNTSGKYISFLDADDIMNKDKIAWSVAELEKSSNVGLVCGNYTRMINDVIVGPFYRATPIINNSSLLRVNYIASGSVTLRREVLSDVGLFNSDYRVAEDYDLWLRISEKYDISYLNKILYTYRIIEDGKSLTQRKDLQRLLDENVRRIKKESVERTLSRCIDGKIK